MARIQLRRDTTANWLAADPVLAQGEQGLDVTTGFLYIGDNTAVYTKVEADNLLATKADKTDTYTKTETYAKSETIALDDLKTLTAASSDFADFQARIANL